jgi:hypothetical protein
VNDEAGQRLWLAVFATLLALMVAAWAYGIYCYIQMVRHRQPGVPASSFLWPPQYLTERGQQFRRRALWSYGIFAALALSLIGLNYLVMR